MKINFIFIFLLFFSFSASSKITYYKDIRPIIEQRCINCHSTKAISFSFEDPESTYLFKEVIVSAIQSKRMPPWLAEAGHQTYVDDESLPEEILSKFNSWKLNGYAKGEPKQILKNVSYNNLKSQFKSDLAINVLPNKEYLPNQKRKDDYRCFIIEWPENNDVYLTGFKTKPGNLKVAHHLVAFAIEPEAADIYKYLDEQENGPGYQCFGGAVPDRLDDDIQKKKLEEKYPGGFNKIQRGNFWLAHWAPGMDGYSFPSETGILIRSGSLIVLQMHYYSAFAPGESDSNSIVEFQLANKVSKPAINFPLTSNKWLDAQNNNSMVIKPGENATFETRINFSSIAAKTAHILRVPKSSIKSLELHSANIHMHSYGASGMAYLTTSNGVKEILLSIPRWDLDWQRDFTFKTPKIINSDHFKKSKLSVECHFANPTNKMIYGGYGSDDEMCFNFSYIAVDLKGSTYSDKVSP